MGDYLFVILLSASFLYSIFNIKKQFSKYKNLKHKNDLNKYRELKILIWELSSIIIVIVLLIMLIIVSVFDLWHLVKWD
jgi:uncharacterized membrane protein YidH (DUF202 family)